MKDSGIKWIGSIPDTWKVIKVKYHCSLKGRIGWQGLTTDEYVDEGPFLITGTDFNVNDGVINWDSCMHVSEWRYDQAPEIQVHNGDLLITKDGTVGKVAIVTNIVDKTTLNSGVMVIRPKEDAYETKFLYYVLKSEEFWKWFHYINSGNTTISHLYQHDLNHFYYAITDRAEQRAIIEFLDQKCQQADVIIGKVKEQIELLHRARASFISRGTTRGSAQDCQLVETRNRWFPQVPPNWKVMRLKYACEKITDGSHFSPALQEEGETYITVTNIHEGKVHVDEGSKILAADYEKLVRAGCQPAIGDVLLTKDGTIGRTAIVETNNYVLLSSIAILTPTKEVLPKYLQYALDSHLSQMQMLDSKGGSALQRITLTKIYNYFIAVPPVEEQRNIIKHLDKKCSVIDRIMKEKQNELNILEKQKKSLINEYITGKKRVIGYA